jgi:hypothetical protein
MASATISNSGILSVSGTTGQVIATTSAGDVSLSLPQSIATTSTPTFGGLTINGTANVTTLQVGGVTATSAATNNAVVLRSAAGSVSLTSMTLNQWNAWSGLGGLTTGLSTGVYYMFNGGTSSLARSTPVFVVGAQSASQTADLQQWMNSAGIVAGVSVAGNITANSISSLNTALSIANGGTGATTAALALNALGAVQKRTGTLDFSATTVASVNHGLGTLVTAQSFDGSGFLIDMDVQNTSASGGTTIYTVSATSATATNFSYVIVG